MVAIKRDIMVPADRRVSFTVPDTVPEGETSVVLVFPAPMDRTAGDDSGGVQDMDATEYLMRDPANREYLLRAIDDVEHGRNLVSVPADMFPTIASALSQV